MLSKVIETYKRIYVFPHMLPDGDTLGSAVALTRFLESINKEVYIVLNDDVPSHLLFMCKDVTIYKSTEVKGIKPDCVICVDSGAPSMYADREELIGNAYLVNIDHHGTNTQYGDHQILDFSAASAGEIIYDILVSEGYEFTEEAATALFVAVSTDTGSFKYSNTTSRTFKTAGDLMTHGIDINTINVELYQNMPYENMRLKSELFSRAEYLFDNKLVISVMDEDVLSDLDIAKPNTEGIVEYMRDVQGVEVVVFIKWMGEDNYKISMRSKHDCDVAKVALEFEGGGHKKAAGFRYKGNISELKKQVSKHFEVSL